MLDSNRFLKSCGVKIFNILRFELPRNRLVSSVKLSLNEFPYK